MSSCVDDETLPLGAEDPYFVKVAVTDRDEGFDDFQLDTITSAKFRVTKPDGTEVTWTASIVGTPTPTSLDLIYVLQSGDIDVCGEWKVLAVMVPGGGGEVFAETRVFTVFDP